MPTDHISNSHPDCLRCREDRERTTQLFGGGATPVPAHYPAVEELSPPSHPGYAHFKQAYQPGENLFTDFRVTGIAAARAGLDEVLAQQPGGVIGKEPRRGILAAAQRALAEPGRLQLTSLSADASDFQTATVTVESVLATVPYPEHMHEVAYDAATRRLTARDLVTGALVADRVLETPLPFARAQFKGCGWRAPKLGQLFTDGTRMASGAQWNDQRQAVPVRSERPFPTVAWPEDDPHLAIPAKAEPARASDAAADVSGFRPYVNVPAQPEEHPYQGHGTVRYLIDGESVTPIEYRAQELANRRAKQAGATDLPVLRTVLLHGTVPPPSQWSDSGSAS